MKKVLFLLLLPLILGAVNLNAQVRIGGDAAPEKGAVLDLKSVFVGGLLLPHVEIVALNEIPSDWIGGPFDSAVLQKLKGLIVYNEVESQAVPKGIYVWDGSAWRKLI